MQSLWCTRKNIARGFKIELVACVACACKKRKVCQSYADVALEDIAKANLISKAQGHGVAEDLPLFEQVLND